MSASLLFGELFYGLRQAGIEVTPQEWMALMQALSRGAIEPDLTDFYAVARSILIKSETLFDTWDQVFAAVFADGEMPTKAAEELLEWLQDPKPLPELSEEELEKLESLPLEELRKLFEKRLEEQDERHDGGNRWIGTGGTSPFGHSGMHPEGVRVGGSGGNRSAVQIASKRRFRDLRKDRVLETRDIAVALKKLRKLTRSGGEPELDVEETIDETCRQAGELELVFRPPRRNEARVLLLMDVGGSMDPHTRRVERLFSAASALNHWKHFEAYTFHNCVYEKLFSSIERGESVLTHELLHNRLDDTFLILVGDASMAPSELVARWGAIDYWHRNETPGLMWLHRLRKRFPRSVWLNPLPQKWWRGWSIQIIEQIFPMYPLTLQGLEDAVDTLLQRVPPPVPELDLKDFLRRAL